MQSEKSDEDSVYYNPIHQEAGREKWQEQAELLLFKQFAIQLDDIFIKCILVQYEIIFFFYTNHFSFAKTLFYCKEIVYLIRN